MSSDSCHCGSEKKFATCCLPLINSTEPAPSAERLMRSRYSAFATKNFDYIIKTTDPDSVLHFDQEANRQWMNSVQFLKLEILKIQDFGLQSQVEFKAWFHHEGTEHCHHENSHFVKHGENWYYKIQ